MKAPYTEPQVRETEGHREVLDPVRHRWVTLTPEEWVRQNLIHRLHYQYGYPLELMQVEGAISLNGLTRRCDIVLYDTNGHPLMIVECKKPDRMLNQEVCDQACRYNTVLHVPYLLLCNGRQQIMIAVDFQKGLLKQLPDIPFFEKKC